MSAVLESATTNSLETETAFSPPFGSTKAHQVFLSIVIVDPCHDPFVKEQLQPLVTAVSPLVADFEIIVIDNAGAQARGHDHYSDLTRPGGLPNIQVFRLLQQVHVEAAAWAGVENALGDFVLVFDPYNEDLSRLNEAIRIGMSGVDLVLIHNETVEPTGFLSRSIGSAFRRVFRYLYGIDLARDASQFRLISKRVISYLEQVQHPELRFRSLPVVAGFRREIITYRAHRRRRPDHGLLIRARRAFDIMFSESLAPLRLVSLLALFGAISNVFYSIYVLAIAFYRSDVAKGWTTISLQQSGMFLLISLVLYVALEYLIHMAEWRMNGGPYFIVSEATSDVMTRTQRLNVEDARSVR